MKNPRVVARMVPFKGNEWLKLHHEAIYKLLYPYIKGKKILDAGCGCGLGSWIWANNGADYIEAYDFSKEALNFAQKNYSSQKIKFRQLDFNIEKIPRTNYFDIVCSIEVIEHLKNYNFYFRNIYHSLKKGGILFLTTPNALLSPQNNQFHIKEFTPQELEELLKKYDFEIIEKYGLNVNKVSQIAGKYFPSSLIFLIKKFSFYSQLVNILARPNIKSIKRNYNNEETLIFITKKL